MLTEYCGVEDAAREVMKQGRNTVLAKVDIKSAYRVVPVHPDDRWLLGMNGKGPYLWIWYCHLG